VNVRKMINAALKKEAMDLVLKGGKVLNLFTHELIPADLAILKDTIVGIGQDYVGKQTIDVSDQIICPGFIDAHVHLESTLLTPWELAKAVLPCGTTAMICDPHEIANVLGIDGIKFILESSQNLPLDIFIMLPSCVPATHLETSGAKLEAKDLVGLLENPRVLGLAEVMNFPGVITGHTQVLNKILLAKNYDKLVDGHAPSLTGAELQAYCLTGIDSDHECTTLKEAKEKLSLGMYIMLREGSSEHNLVDLLPLVNPSTVKRCMLVSDDKHPHDLLTQGHLDHGLRLSIEHGLNPMLAIEMVTLSPAHRFGLKNQGAIAPGYKADLVILNDLRQIKIDKVFTKGKLVVDQGQVLDFKPNQCTLPKHSLKIKTDLNFKIPVQGKYIRVIQVVPRQILTKTKILEPTIKDGMAVADPERDLLKLAVIERHKGTGNVGLGFVQGLGLKKGAIASTVSHDSHNLIVAGTNDSDLEFSVKTLTDWGGGFVLVKDGRILAGLKLPIAGLMSDEPLLEVSNKVKQIEKMAFKLGAKQNPLMVLSFLALPVIPSLRLTDKGLVDVDKFTLVDLFLN